MISAATTKAIDNLSRELSEKQEIANRTPQCIFLSVCDEFLSTFPSDFKSTFESLEKCFPPFSYENYNYLNLSFNFICLFISYVKISCLSIYCYNFSGLLLR